MFFQLLTVTLKLENYVGWEWKNVFWMTWIILVTIGFYLIGLFILLLLTSYYTFRGDADAFQLKGLIWCFSNICDFSIGIFLALLGFIKLMNTKDESMTKLKISNFFLFYLGYLKIVCLIIFSWSIANLFYTKFFFQDIMCLFSFFKILFLNCLENLSIF